MNYQKVQSSLSGGSEQQEDYSVREFIQAVVRSEQFYRK